MSNPYYWYFRMMRRYPQPPFQPPTPWAPQPYQQQTQHTGLPPVQPPVPAHYPLTPGPLPPAPIPPEEELRMLEAYKRLLEEDLRELEEELKSVEERIKELKRTLGMQG